jgi:hypothetical protein
MSHLTEIVIAGDAERWRAVGLAVGDDARATVGRVGLRFVPVAPGGPPGMRALGFLMVSATSIDGIAVHEADPPAPSQGEHPNGAHLVDHVVVMTPDLDRTSAAVVAALGIERRRVRDAGRGVTQGFFRTGEVIVEIVQSPHVPEGDAALWGLVFVVDDLDAVCEQLGPDLVGLPRAAVQPGRFIASVREPAAGLGVPLAFMSA